MYKKERSVGSYIWALYQVKHLWIQHQKPAFRKFRGNGLSQLFNVALDTKPTI